MQQRYQDAMAIARYFRKVSISIASLISLQVYLFITSGSAFFEQEIFLNASERVRTLNASPDLFYQGWNIAGIRARCDAKKQRYSTDKTNSME
jgi:hypothetical protein